jgi:imidazolonepropionase-like amidohydrolase
VLTALVLGCAPAPTVDDALIIRGVTVIDGTGAPPRDDMAVLVRGDRIAAIGPSDAVDCPTGGRVIDGSGKYLIPGLWDMHVHLSKTRASALTLFVKEGVTSVRDMGGELEELLTWRETIRRGDRLGPRIVLAGPYLEAPENVQRMLDAEVVEPVGRTRIPVGDPQRARAVVDSLAALGVDFIKIRTLASLATYRGIVAAARAHDLRVVGHTFGIPLRELIETGHGSIEHFLYPPPGSVPTTERAALYAELVARDMAVVPTLVNFEASILLSPDTLDAIVGDSLGLLDDRRRYVSRFLIADWGEQVAERREDSGVDWREIYEDWVATLREMRQAGVRILAGSDVAVINIYPGSSLHEELGWLVQAVGMTPHEALMSATRHPAEFLGLSHELGTVEPGKLADLVLLTADPLADISNLGEIDAVIVRGRHLGRAELVALQSELLMAEDLARNDWQ